MSKEGYLFARYIAGSSYEFEFNAVYSLKYQLRDGRIRVEDALGEGATYDSLKEFRSEWDMNNVPDRYKAANPDLDE